MRTHSQWFEYLIKTAKLNPVTRHWFTFEDGTGFCGTAEEFSYYAVRRYSVIPRGSFEIEEDLTCSRSFEIYPPTEEGEVLMPGTKRDTRLPLPGKNELWHWKKQE